MDPTTNLKEQLCIARSFVDKDPDELTAHQMQLALNDFSRLCDLVIDLSGWMSRGGFPPDQWKGRPR